MSFYFMEFHILLAGGVFPLPSVAAALAYDMFLFVAGRLSFLACFCPHLSFPDDPV
jgi:hypothetical protein